MCVILRCLHLIKVLETFNFARYTRIGCFIPSLHGYFYWYLDNWWMNREWRKRIKKLGQHITTLLCSVQLSSTFHMTIGQEIYGYTITSTIRISLLLYETKGKARAGLSVNNSYILQVLVI